MTATGPRERVARRCGSVQAWSPPISSGTTPGLDDRGDRALDRLVAPLDVAGHDRDVAVVDAREDVERLDVEVRVVGAQHHARGAHPVRTEPAAGAVGDAGIERDADDRQVDLLERPHVRQPGERRRPGEPRALERVLRDVARRTGARRAPSLIPREPRARPGRRRPCRRATRRSPTSPRGRRRWRRRRSTRRGRPGIARRSAVRTAVISSSTFSARVARAVPSAWPRGRPR